MPLGSSRNRRSQSRLSFPNISMSEKSSPPLMAVPEPDDYYVLEFVEHVSVGRAPPVADFRDAFFKCLYVHADILPQHASLSTALQKK